MTTADISVSVIAPLEFRFLDPDDIKLAGDRWYCYDEAAIVRLPAGRLLELEEATGHSVRAMMAALRGQRILGDLLATWTAVHLVDPEAAGEFDAWQPVVFSIEWRPAEETAAGKGDVSSADTPDPTPTVALATLPAAE